ncbi:RNA demethylase ALKBH9B-like [Actinidia eriantha]|uniref:RNA demethylase ALKBH9B-like n=1 Tax=Actinidia eriantha TaxID=165200 RepID=UPI00258987CE|nr:RNA demethylase ALKBH9B-like [Actinidia eriantha]
MTGEFSGESTESGAGCGLRGMLKNMSREEILEIFSEGEGFCQHCEALLQSRVQRIMKKKSSEQSESSGNNQSSTEFWSANSTSRSSIQTPEPVHSGTRKGFANLSPESRSPSLTHNNLLEEQERARFAQIGRKKDFVLIERIDGRAMNVLQGLELHSRVFSPDEQKEIVDCVYRFQRMGQKGQLRARTYSEPKKWMRGKGRVTIQFGCCYNYAVDKNGNPPGIVRNEEVDPLPPLFKQMIKRMVRWHVLPPTCVPNSCIVNIYDEGDCIPPHIDHHDFLRPFCTVSFLTECNILFGSNLKVVSAGEFAGPVSVPLPVGSVLILSGNGADVAKHCVPSVPARRISITFRKMDDSKLPYRYASDPELTGIRPFARSPITKMLAQPPPPENNNNTRCEPITVAVKASNNSVFSKKDDFPPLGSLSIGNKPRANGNGRKQ